MKFVARIVLAAGLALCGCGSSSASTTSGGKLRAKRDAGSVDAALARQYDGAILGFVAAQAYQDFALFPGGHDNSKFEAFLLPTIDPSEIESLHVSGPDGFEFELDNTPYSAQDLNGYIMSDRVPLLWYQALRPSTLADGRYTLAISFTNGERQEASRVLTTDQTLLDSYLALRDAMWFEPDMGTSQPTDTILKWSTLSLLGGVDAYYDAWISSGSTDAIQNDNLRGDNIFIDAVLAPETGFNAASSRVGSTDDPLPLGPLTWQVEITDSNQLDQLNQIIFTPAQHFQAQ